MHNIEVIRLSHIFRQVKTAIQFQCNPNINFSPHLHDDIELIYVVRGGGMAFCDGRQYALTEGDLFLVFPNQIHHYAQSLQGEYIVLILKPSHLRYHEDVFLDGHPQSVVYHATEELSQLLKTAFAEFRQNGDSCAVDGYLTVFFEKLLPHYDIQKTDHSQQCVWSVLQYCREHFREKITVQDVSQHLHISYSYVAHIFSQQLHIGFCNYINSLRLTEAVTLLKSGGYTMAEISSQVGFSTIRTFNRAFLKQYGISPSAYLKTLKR